jgi:hypothetical protein
MPLSERRLELALAPTGPWHATVNVYAVQTNHGRRSSLPQDWLFEVHAEWFGPPAVGFPPSPVPVSARDVVIVETLEEAKAIAFQAHEQLRNGGDHPPDLRDFLARNSVAFAPRRENGAAR